MQVQQTKLTAISRKQRKSVTADPSVVERVASEFLDSQGAQEFTHYRTIRASGKSVLSLFCEPRKGARRFKKPLTASNLGKSIPLITTGSLYPPKPEEESVQRGWVLGVMMDRLILTATWCKEG